MKNILMMLGMCLTVLFGYNMSNSVTEVNTHNNVREVKVQAGDTMWDIAARTAHKDMDVREMVYAMKELKLNIYGLIPRKKAATLTEIAAFCYLMYVIKRFIVIV
ncbi:MAG: hypothetical protein E6951_05680 [Veillonella parvula]|nr:hypothetical protein [Veillonella parvula]